MITRRTFIKAGLVGGALLGAGGLWYAATRESAAPGRFGPQTRAMFAALAPVMLAGALPDEAAARDAVVDGVETAYGGLSPAAQGELADLFGLLSFPPARRVLTGIGDWQRASPTQIEAFLADWRFHRLALLQAGYAALHDLVLGAWYARPESWEAIGYPGPPEFI